MMTTIMITMVIMKLIFYLLQGTSTSVERIFSGGSDLITKKRNGLKKDTIRACMCMKYWIKENHINKITN